MSKILDYLNQETCLFALGNWCARSTYMKVLMFLGIVAILLFIVFLVDLNRRNQESQRIPRI